MQNLSFIIIFWRKNVNYSQMKRPLQHQTYPKKFPYEGNVHHPNLKKIAMRPGTFSKFPRKMAFLAFRKHSQKFFWWNMEVNRVPTDHWKCGINWRKHKDSMENKGNFWGKMAKTEKNHISWLVDLRKLNFGMDT